MGGSAQQPTQTTTAQPSAQQSQLFNAVWPNIEGLTRTSPPQYYPDQTVAAFNPAQEAAQGMALGAAPAQQDIAQWSTDLAKSIPTALQWGLPAGTENVPTSSNIFSDPGVWNPGFNPGLQSAIEAAQRPVWQGLTEQALPAIRTTANATGPYGGSRQGIAEGLATSRATQQAGDIASKMTEDEYNANLQALQARYGANLGAGVTERGQTLSALGQNYGQNLSALYQTLGLAPSLQSQWTTPAATVGAVGDAQQQQQQAQLAADVARWNYNQSAPLSWISSLLGLGQSFPGGSTVSTGNVPQANAGMQALGGAASGAALGSAIMPGAGTAVGAGAGALLPFLFR
jgi:hypothetical protein